MASLTPRIDRLENNKIINGGMDFWQRGTSGFNSSEYCADRWRISQSTPAYTFDQATDSPVSNFLYSVRGTVTSATATAAANNYRLIYNMEGYDYASISTGQVKLSFYAKASIAGTYSIAFRTTGRSHISEYTIDSPNTWEQKVISINMDQSLGTGFTNSIGLEISWMMSCGTDFQTSILDQWQVGDLRASSNQIDLTATPGATFQIAQVMLNEGEATGEFNRAGRSIGEEFALCQRYYEKSTSVGLPIGTSSGPGQRQTMARSNGQIFESTEFGTEKRTNGTVVITYASGGATSPGNIGTRGFSFVTTGLGASSSFALHWTADAEL